MKAIHWIILIALSLVLPVAGLVYGLCLLMHAKRPKLNVVRRLENGTYLVVKEAGK